MTHPPSPEGAPEPEPEPEPEPTGRDPESGGGTVLALGVIGVVLAVLFGAMVLGAAVLASQQARSAADLAALAAARTGAPSCAEARRTARANGGELHDCRVEGAFVEVVVTVRPVGGARRLGEARGRARAGPAHGAPAVGGAAPAVGGGAPAGGGGAPAVDGGGAPAVSGDRPRSAVTPSMVRRAGEVSGGGDRSGR